MYPAFYPGAYPYPGAPTTGAAVKVTHRDTVALPARTAVPPAGTAIPNNGSTVLLVENTTNSPGSVAIQIAVTVDGLRVGPRIFTVDAHELAVVPLGPPRWYGRTTIVKPSAGVHVAAITI